MTVKLPEKMENLTEEQLNERLLRAAIRLNTWLLAAVFAFVIGFSLFGLTYLALFRGMTRMVPLLNLLGVFLPGYEVSHSGAWIGLFWGAVIGAFCAILFYRVYARSINIDAQGFLIPDPDDDQLTHATLLLNGKYMGLASGLVVAGGLIVSTNWLVFRGTADTSVHAMLLVNYLPGYSISLMGSLRGALELFIITFFLSWLFSQIYNKLATSRSILKQ